MKSPEERKQNKPGALKTPQAAVQLAQWTQVTYICISSHICEHLNITITLGLSQSLNTKR